VPCQRGLLVSTEGLSGTGKTYLTTRLLAENPALAAQALIISEFSRRPPRGELGHELLGALTDAAAGDVLLRGGQPAAETLLLLAIKTHDYEAHCLPALRHGHVVFEGRSLHCTAVYQSLITHPSDEDQARSEMLAILNIASQWRPLPDLTFLITDDPSAAAKRAEQRDGRAFSPGYRRIHDRAAALYEQAATDGPGNITVIDRRHLTASDAITLMHTRIKQHRQALTCLHDLTACLPANSPCADQCRLTSGQAIAGGATVASDRPGR
jgi:dTMP kinase